MVRKLIACLGLAALLVSAAGLSGCSPGSYDAPMLTKEEAKGREKAYTPEQWQQRQQRPR